MPEQLTPWPAGLPARWGCWHSRVTKEADTRLTRAIRRGARLAGLIALALGALVLSGWALGIPGATSVAPGLPPMQPVAAVAIAATGLALWLRQAARPARLARLSRGAAYAIAAAVTLLGALIVGEHLLGWRLPLDAALLPAWGEGSPQAGPPPLATTLSLTCLAVAILLLGGDGHTAAGIAQLLALGAALTGVRVLLGFVDEEGVYAIATPRGVAVHSAAALILLGLGALCARPRSGLMAAVSGQGHGSQIFRLLLPAAVLLPLLIGALSLGGRLAGLFSLGFGLTTLTFANLLVFWWLAHALNRSESVALREAARARDLLRLAERRTGRLQALRKVDLAIIHQHHALGAMLDTLIAQARDQLDVDAAAILLVPEGQDRLIYARSAGFRALPTGVDASADPSYLGEALRAHRVAGSADTPGVARAPQPAHAAAEGFTAGYAAPVVVERQIAGVLEVAFRDERRLDGEGASFLEALAGQAAIALATFRLFTDLGRTNEALVRAYDETLGGWSYALELRDGETRGHTQRVTELTIRLAEACGIAGEELVHIKRGAMLHDIGKLGVPDAVLLKPGRLTAEEWAQMRMHPTYAYEWLRPISYLWPALDIPYCHHEKWDGTGYPRGLKGEDIPLAARIFAVVDVWDALCSERPYHPPWPAEQVRAYIAEQAGSHFDPRVVEVFLRLVGEEGAQQACSTRG